MSLNPIITAVARRAAAMDSPISSVSITSPLVTGTALLSISWAKFDDGQCDIDDMPAGVGVRMMCRAPDSVAPLPPMVDAEGMAIGAAWAHGAWDINRTVIPAGYDGPLPPNVALIADAVREQGYVSWTWRPMLRGPEIRAKQKRPDLTLDKWTLGRDGAPPEVRRPPIVAGRSVLIKLGDDGTRKPAASRRRSWLATDRQRAYLQVLLRKAGEDETLPDDLDKRSASAWIDRLTGTAIPAPAPKPRKRSLRITVNQWRLIDHYLSRLGRGGLPINTMRLMTHDKAQAMLAELQALLVARSKRDAA